MALHRSIPPSKSKNTLSSLLPLFCSFSPLFPHLSSAFLSSHLNCLLSLLLLFLYSFNSSFLPSLLPSFLPSLLICPPPFCPPLIPNPLCKLYYSISSFSFLQFCPLFIPLPIFSPSFIPRPSFSLYLLLSSFLLLLSLISPFWSLSPYLSHLVHVSLPFSQLLSLLSLVIFSSLSLFFYL